MKVFIVPCSHPLYAVANQTVLDSSGFIRASSIGSKIAPRVDRSIWLQAPIFTDFKFHVLLQVSTLIYQAFQSHDTEMVESAGINPMDHDIYYILVGKTQSQGVGQHTDAEMARLISGSIEEVGEGFKGNCVFCGCANFCLSLAEYICRRYGNGITLEHPDRKLIPLIDFYEIEIGEQCSVTIHTNLSSDEAED